MFFLRAQPSAQVAFTATVSLYGLGNTVIPLIFNQSNYYIPQGQQTLIPAAVTGTAVVTLDQQNTVATEYANFVPQNFFAVALVQTVVVPSQPIVLPGLVDGASAYMTLPVSFAAPISSTQTLSISCSAALTSLTCSPASMTFTAANWNVPQNIVIDISAGVPASTESGVLEISSTSMLT